MRPRKPSPTLLVAIAALVVALGGTAVAASRYIITSSAQIKPSVLRELRSSPAASDAKVAKGAKAIVARAYSVGSVSAKTEPEKASDPLTGGTWTQGAKELNQVTGEATVNVPPVTQCGHYSNDQPSSAFGEVLVDSHRVATFSTQMSGASETTETVQFSAPAWLFESGEAKSHTLAVEVSDLCGYGGGPGTAHFTVDSVAIDVIAVR